jgi:hypothetical protein
MNEYVIIDLPDETHEVVNFRWESDTRNNLHLSWQWPHNPDVKLMLIFTCTDEEIPDVAQLIASEHPYELVTRGLKNTYTAEVRGKCRIVAVPGFFGESRKIMLYRPTLTTDWIFEKQHIRAEIIEKPLKMGKYKQVSLRITPLSEELSQVLTYKIDTNEYPLDAATMSGRAFFYIEKEQTVRFVIDPAHAHLYEITTTGGMK